MIKIFPSTKWVKTATAEHQLTKVFEELNEVSEHLLFLMYSPMKVRNITNQLECDREMADLYHATQGYFEIRERDGLDVDKLVQKTIEKNRKRGYYGEGKK